MVKNRLSSSFSNCHSVDNLVPEELDLVPEELDLVPGKAFSSWSSIWESLVSGLVPIAIPSSWVSIWQKLLHFLKFEWIKNKNSFF
jgi:hypothetical protein